MARQTVLPDGEFFSLQDERDDFCVLLGRRIRVAAGSLETGDDQYDEDPARSEALSKARFERLRSLDPNRQNGDLSHSLFHDRRFRLDPELISPSSYFCGPPPQAKVHFDILRDFAREDVIGLNGISRRLFGSYLFVSDTWKDAIESLEPGVHQFFPHEVEFAYYTMNNHFIFRECIEIDCLHFANKESIRSGRKGRDLVGAVVRRDLIEGRHWVRAPGAHWPLVSRALATNLLPLLPEALESDYAVQFVPVALA